MTGACVFDVYGTLFEAHAAIRRHFGRGAGRQQMLEIVARETGRI
jgi:FMN phosphatase YigB (HAD superfamily)